MTPIKTSGLKEVAVHVAIERREGAKSIDGGHRCTFRLHRASADESVFSPPDRTSGEEPDRAGKKGWN